MIERSGSSFLWALVIYLVRGRFILLFCIGFACAVCVYVKSCGPICHGLNSSIPVWRKCYGLAVLIQEPYIIGLP